MLHRINPQEHSATVNSPICAPQSSDDRYSRNEKEDMQLAIEALYEFKKKLNKLHPVCVDLISQMLQTVRY